MACLSELRQYNERKRYNVEQLLAPVVAAGQESAVEEQAGGAAGE